MIFETIKKQTTSKHVLGAILKLNKCNIQQQNINMFLNNSRKPHLFSLLKVNGF